MTISVNSEALLKDKKNIWKTESWKKKSKKEKKKSWMAKKSRNILAIIKCCHTYAFVA